jgi:hypothetical protein
MQIPVTIYAHYPENLEVNETSKLPLIFIKINNPQKAKVLLPQKDKISLMSLLDGQQSNGFSFDIKNEKLFPFAHFCYFEIHSIGNMIHFAPYLPFVEFINQTAKQNVTDAPLDFTSVEIEEKMFVQNLTVDTLFERLCNGDSVCIFNPH